MVVVVVVVVTLMMVMMMVVAYDDAPHLVMMVMMMVVGQLDSALGRALCVGFIVRPQQRQGVGDGLQQVGVGSGLRGPRGLWPGCCARLHGV